MQSKETRGNLSGKFEGFGAAPSEHLWGEISDSLDENKKRRGFIWWWIGSGIAAAIITFVIVFYPDVNSTGIDHETYVEDKNENNLTNTTENIENNKVEDTQENPKVDEVTDQPNNSLGLEVVHNESVDQSSVKDIDKNERSEPEEHQVQIVNNNEKNTTEIENSESQKKEELVEVKTTNNQPLMKMGLNEMSKIPLVNPEINLIDLDKNENKRPWEIGFSIAYYNDDFINYKNDQLSYENSNNIDQGSSFSSPSNVQTTGGTVNKLINVQGFVGKYFKDRLAWRAGLNYSRTTYSTYYMSSAWGTVNTAINAIEIPLQLRWDMIQKDKWKLKWFGGLHNEFSVLEKSQSEIISLASEYSPGFNFGYSGGVETGIGFNYNLTNRMAITLNTSYRLYLFQGISSSQFSIIEKQHWYGGSLGLVWRLE